MRLTSTCVLVLSVLVFAGTASAGNGNGNGSGYAGGAPGNSGSAPGQLKKDDAAAPAASTTTTTTTTEAAAPVTTTATNTTGVKPTNETAHETHAEAQSDKTKQYGNGHTAGQIAERNGASAPTVLHGPGNSQPHKTAPCSGGHEVDVHALKSHRHGASCGEPSLSPAPSPAPGPRPSPRPPVSSQTTTTARKDPSSKPAGGDAPGAVATSATPSGQSDGELAPAHSAATLPFTGARLWILVLAGLVLIATGLAVREIRTAEAAVQSGHDHTDRTRHAARGSDAALGGRSGR